MNIYPHRFTSLAFALGLAIIVSLISISLGSAQDNEAYIRQVQSMEADSTGLLNPVGLAFSYGTGNFYVVEGQGRGLLLTGDTEVVAISALANPVASAGIATTIEDPLNMVFDNRNNRLLALQPTTSQILEIRENPGGNLDRATMIPHNIDRLGIVEPQGLALDEQNGDLYILDADGPRILRLELGPGRSFSGGRISLINLASSGLVAPRGIAFDPATAHLYVFDMIDQTLYELTQDGQVVSTRDMLSFGLRSPGAMVFAPSGDQTDAPEQTSLFLADSGIISGRGAGAGPLSSSQSGSEAGASTENSGQILELSLVEPAPAAASSFTSSLVRTTDLSAISPPSPDPSGIAYIPEKDRLMVVDGEVEEFAYNITHFQGANVWELTKVGAVIRTANISPVEPTVVPMSDEPTGVAWNPNNGHYYFTDDTGSPDVYDLNPGPDGLVGTGDDTWTGFSTSGYGGGDAEGIAYSTWNNHLFVVDGVNAEVYEYTLTGVLVQQFDVLRYGVVDPEAIEFNPDSGTLFVMSSDAATPVLIETTISGDLLQTINISSANARTAAGLAYAPASNGTGAKHFYIVDRGFDNNENGNPIDGKLFEMTAPVAGQTPTDTPIPSRTPTNTPTAPLADDVLYASFALSGSVGGVSFADEDILKFDGQNWSMFFDGSDVGAGSVDLFALSVIDDDTILMAFSNNLTLNGLAVTANDIVRFDATSLGPNTAGTFSMYFDGSDVGLDSSAEKIDALSVLPDGRILISTTGNPSVPGVSARDEDILAFTPTSLGSNTSGSWALYFDGSDVGLGESSGEDIDGLDVVNGNIYLSTTGSFSVNGISGTEDDIFVCAPASLGDVTACNYASGLFFAGSDWGLSGKDVDGFFVGTVNTSPAATATRTNTPTHTATATSPFTPSLTFTATPTNTAQLTSTFTATPTPSRTFTPTNTPLSGASPTNTSPAQSPGDSLYVSFALSGSVGGVSFVDEDILRFDGQNWSMFFDGSDIGAGSVDLFALSVVDDDTILMAFSNNLTLNGLAVTANDIVRFDATSLGPNTAGTFSMYFDGSDVGLDDTTAEKIDALSILPDGRILISTTGNPSVPGISGNDEDILAFTPTSLGSNTSGSWAMYFDGSDVELANSTDEDIDGMDVVGEKIYLSTNGSFAVNGTNGAGEDIFICTPLSLGEQTACAFSPGLFFDGSEWGLSGNSIDGFYLGAGSSIPSSTSTPTRTATNTALPTSQSTSTPTRTATPSNTPFPGPSATNSPTATITLTPTNTCPLRL
jgi:hypothetical protein